MLRFAFRSHLFSCRQHVQPRRTFSFASVFRQQAPPVNPLVLPEPMVEKAFGKPGIRNQILFFVFGSSVLFTGAAIYTNVATDRLKDQFMRESHTPNRWNITNLDLQRFEQKAFILKLRAWHSAIVSETGGITGLLRPWIASAYLAVMQPIADASPTRRFVWGICAFNLSIFLAWKMPSMRSYMHRNWMHDPLSGLSFTLLTSSFSHMSFIHLFFNCFALEGFGSGAALWLSQQQDRKVDMLEAKASYHFLAFFCSAALFSSLASHIFSARVSYSRIVKELATKAVSPSMERVTTWSQVVNAARAAKAKVPVPKILPSLGSSGSIYACLTLVALGFPNSQVSLIFPPSAPIEIQTGVAALVLFDIIGLCLGWRMFDHVAHLGGALFGVGYFYVGPDFWYNLRRLCSSQEPPTIAQGKTATVII